MAADAGVRVCVFCGSNVGASASYLAVARELGAGLAARGLGVVYGGGKVGLMGQLADAALQAGGEVVGVMPKHLVEREIAHRSVEARFVRPDHRSLAQRAVTVAEAIDRATSTPPATPHKWLDLDADRT